MSILFRLPLAAASFFFFAGFALAEERPDILVNDFEAETYGGWKTTGEAFGRGPAEGTLPNQMHVSGYEGKRLVNSFLNGDDSTGTLTSPEFTIERKHLNFLIGGGAYPDETCMNLLHGEQVVRTATGNNDQPGGSEALLWHSWDVSDLAGKKVRIQVIDARQGGWGHINVDQIVQSDIRRQAEPAVRELLVEKRYLHLPVKTGAEKRRVKLRGGEEILREFEIELSASPDFWTFCDLQEFQGKKITIDAGIVADGNQLLDTLTLADDPPGAKELYREKHRPQFHFTSRRGWLNDPNGLVYHNGQWHLFYQHNPYGWNWGNMHWGHATSSDLFHWREQPIALYPQRFGDWCFSGSAVVDKNNTSGFKTGENDVLVAAYTSTGRGECIAYSNDNGQTWREYENNPVVRHRGRDPKIIWHEKTKRWVMAVYTEHEGLNMIAFYNSPDLKNWTFTSRLDGFFECPDLFELPVQGTNRSHWVVFGADGSCHMGDFDGRVFTKKSDPNLGLVMRGNYYAAQTYDNAPGGRRILIGWGRDITFPGMPFNQQMTVPLELTIRETAQGDRIFAEPVKELANLHGKQHAFEKIVLTPEPKTIENIPATELRIFAELELGAAERISVVARGVEVRYDVESQRLMVGGKARSLLRPENDGILRLEILVDRGSVEVFGEKGKVALSQGVLVGDSAPAITVSAAGTGAVLRKLEVFELKSAWEGGEG